MHTRTGPQPLTSPSLYCSGRSGLSSLSTDKLITCHRGRTGRSSATSSTQREAIHAHGQIGSNQKSTGVNSCSGMSLLAVGGKRGAAGHGACAPFGDNRPALGDIPPGCDDPQSPEIPGPTLRRPLTMRLETERRDHHVASNLTRDEAHDRARLLDVRSYHVDLDLTGGEPTFT